MNNFVYVAKTQHGKTFVSIKNIEMDIEDDDIEGRSLHIVLTMNTLCNEINLLNDSGFSENTVMNLFVLCKNIGNFTMIKVKMF